MSPLVGQSLAIPVAVLTPPRATAKGGTLLPTNSPKALPFEFETAPTNTVSFILCRETP